MTYPELATSLLRSLYGDQSNAEISQSLRFVISTAPMAGFATNTKSLREEVEDNG